MFDPSQKSHFLSQTLNVAIPHISESVWFNRVLPRFNEQLLELPEMYYPITKPLFHILEHCESHNIHKMKPWIRKLMEAAPHNKLVSFYLFFVQFNQKPPVCFYFCPTVAWAASKSLPSGVLQLIVLIFRLF